ncbi:hypothetical protein MAPG_01708 [Magnaporthiopsis poae ATCC 64411]|uniref:Uncharacterized protein n=1 Tax=Magnaporthiopsis poae (strain ATCC 64411 / 73-15) TaxID=644358 RepID=A0A0C4DPE4_MAGP6|nr:hypothetical protein MAPG_01708 [Magnaporthiopsis poae ATCC 64411]
MLLEEQTAIDAHRVSEAPLFSVPSPAQPRVRCLCLFQLSPVSELIGQFVFGRNACTGILFSLLPLEGSFPWIVLVSCAAAAPGKKRKTPPHPFFLVGTIMAPSPRASRNSKKRVPEVNMEHKKSAPGPGPALNGLSFFRACLAWGPRPIEPPRRQRWYRSNPPVSPPVLLAYNATNAWRPVDPTIHDGWRRGWPVHTYLGR